MTQIVTQIFHQVDLNVSNNTQITPKYDMNMSDNIKLTKLLGPSLSPRCALINETCEKKTMTQLDKQQAIVHLQSSSTRNMNNRTLYQPVDLENPVNCYSSNAVLGTAK